MFDITQRRSEPQPFRVLWPRGFHKSAIAALGSPMMASIFTQEVRRVLGSEERLAARCMYGDVLGLRIWGCLVEFRLPDEVPNSAHVISLHAPRETGNHLLEELCLAESGNDDTYA